MKKIINIIGFYVVWCSCMLGASNDLPYLGPMVMVVLLIAHRFLFVRNIKEIYLVLIVGIVGTVVDTAQS